ncbi:MAG: hypothetical protein HQ521_17800 [Bacteroidetes bacterium]|nr:hypothetical protein [Bacteroidota bacterium]
MNFEELKSKSIEATKNALGKDAPDNWDYVTEDCYEGAEEEDESKLKPDAKGVISVYGHDASLCHTDNKWYYKRDQNNTESSGGCGTKLYKWKCEAKASGSCSSHDKRYIFTKKLSE